MLGLWGIIFGGLLPGKAMALMCGLLLVAAMGLARRMPGSAAGFLLLLLGEAGIIGLRLANLAPSQFPPPGSSVIDPALERSLLEGLWLLLPPAALLSALDYRPSRAKRNTLYVWPIWIAHLVVIIGLYGNMWAFSMLLDLEPSTSVVSPDGQWEMRVVAQGLLADINAFVLHRRTGQSRWCYDRHIGDKMTECSKVDITWTPDSRRVDVDLHAAGIYSYELRGDNLQAR